jgi:uncharacterized protein
MHYTRRLLLKFYSVAMSLLCASILLTGWTMIVPALAQNSPLSGVAPSTGVPSQSLTRSQKRRLHGEMVARINANTVSIISGTPGAGFFRIATDIALALDDGENLRVLPIMGKGAEQNLYDILYLKGVDMGLVRTDTLDTLKQDPRVDAPETQLVYIAKLFNEELQVVASTNVTSIYQLAGKKVNFDLLGSGANFTGHKLFDELGITVVATNYDQATAKEMLKRGEIAAIVVIGGKPVATLANFRTDGKFHLINIPYTDKVAQTYLPSSFTNADYPYLVAKGETTNSIAVSTVLCAYNWPEGSERYARLAHFTDIFFGKLASLQTAARLAKWREVNLNATVPGWQRFKPAQEWLDSHGADQSAKQLAQFKAFVRSHDKGDLADPEQEKKLFQEFLLWSRTQNQNQ